MIKFKGSKKVAYYFEGEQNNEQKITKKVPPGQWDIFCCMPFSLGSIYSIELKTIGKTHKGPILKKGLANLSKDNNFNTIGIYNENKNVKSKQNNNKNDSLYNNIFNEEGEALDDKGFIKQYIHPASSVYYIGLENSSNQPINMNLTLTGLYEKNAPNLSKINFIINPMTRRIFTLNFIEGFKGDFSFMFDKI